MPTSPPRGSFTRGQAWSGRCPTRLRSPDPAYRSSPGGGHDQKARAGLPWKKPFKKANRPQWCRPWWWDGWDVIASSQSEVAASSPRRSQLDSRFVERGTLQVNRLRRAAVIVLFSWNGCSDARSQPEPARKERRDPLKLARYYQSLLDSGKFQNRAALARYLGVSRARVTNVLSRLKNS